MRKNFGSQTWLFPMPVLMIGTYDEKGEPDVMNAAWGGIYDTGKIGICLGEDHKTTANILLKKEYTVSFATAKSTVAADYVGLVSQNADGDKMKKSGLHPFKAEHVDAPLFEEFPVALECRFLRYEEESGYLTGEIVNVCAEESVLGEDGKIDMRKHDPILYDSATHAYHRVGEKAGQAFADGNKLK